MLVPPDVGGAHCGEDSEFYPTKEQARRMERWDVDGLTELVPHDYEPAREGVCDLIRRVHAPDERRG
jgi:hypothetical protein